MFANEGIKMGLCSHTIMRKLQNLDFLHYTQILIVVELF